MNSWLVAVRRWLLVGRDEPMFVSPPPERAVREREWQQALDAESAVLRTSSDCRRRMVTKRTIPGLVERIRVRGQIDG